MHVTAGSSVLDREVEQEKNPGAIWSAHPMPTRASHPARKISGLATGSRMEHIRYWRRVSACLHQWTSTQCLSCARWSPHSEWYAELPQVATPYLKRRGSFVLSKGIFR